MPQTLAIVCQVKKPDETLRESGASDPKIQQVIANFAYSTGAIALANDLIKTVFDNERTRPIPAITRRSRRSRNSLWPLQPLWPLYAPMPRGFQSGMAVFVRSDDSDDFKQITDTRMNYGRFAAVWKSLWSGQSIQEQCQDPGPDCI
jgi:hypothetical protein